MNEKLLIVGKKFMKTDTLDTFDDSSGIFKILFLIKRKLDLIMKY